MHPLFYAFPQNIDGVRVIGQALYEEMVNKADTFSSHEGRDDWEIWKPSLLNAMCPFPCSGSGGRIMILSQAPLPYSLYQW